MEEARFSCLEPFERTIWYLFDIYADAGQNRPNLTLFAGFEPSI